MKVLVSELWIYPVKACRGISLPRCSLDTWGPVHDREWMIVDSRGRFVSQRTHPTLCRVETELSQGVLQLRAPGRRELTVSGEPGEARREVQVWKDRVPAWEESSECSAWFSEYLGMPCTLVRRGKDFARPVDPNYAPPGHTVSFADGYPVLLISQASLDDLCARTGLALGMSRFRPNVIVTGCPPYAEDSWRTFDLGGMRMHGVKRCARCPVTTIDPLTAQLGKEPLTTLASYRRARGGVIFGQNVIYDGPGELQVGDALHVVEEAAVA